MACRSRTDLCTIAHVTDRARDLERFRSAKDEFFLSDPRSPLTREQRTGFAGLAHFAEDPALAFEVVLDTVVDHEMVMLATTTGEPRPMQRAGIVRFEVDRAPAQVTLFTARDDPGLFLPFRDATSGHETYGAGRYLDVQAPDTAGRVVVDFNLAYNPYCAYSEGYSCPLPPAENWLLVPIRAGEMTFEP
jgi:uncharacterized protein (DUF1684 family)